MSISVLLVKRSTVQPSGKPSSGIGGTPGGSSDSGPSSGSGSSSGSGCSGSGIGGGGVRDLIIRW